MADAAEKFREEHDKLHAELTTPERTKSVCEVCGVFVNSTDNEQRRLVRCPSTLNVPCLIFHRISCFPASIRGTHHSHVLSDHEGFFIAGPYQRKTVCWLEKNPGQAHRPRGKVCPRRRRRGGASS